MILSRVIKENKNSTLKPWFKTGVSVGNLSTTYTEYSGLTNPGKLQNKDYLWAIEDGATNYVLAINRNTAALSGKWTVTGMSTTDVEDCTSCVVNNVPYLFLCDTGDNGNARATFNIFRIAEPTITGSDGTVTSYTQIVCQFPGGNLPSHKDVETVLSDPDSGDLYFVTKRISPIKLYRLPFADTYSGTQTLEYVTDLNGDSTLNTLSTTYSANNGYAVGGNISPNGSEIIIRSYSSLYIWRRNKSKETIGQCLARIYDSILTHSYVGGGGNSSITAAPKCLHPGQEPQGESVSFDYEGINMYTCSEYLANEGSSASAYPLFKYVRVNKSPNIVELQNGLNSYTGCTDTYIDSSAPTTDFSAAISLVADLDFSAYPTISRTRQVLIKYDLSSIPSNATVIGAYLNIYINTEGKIFSLHRMLSSWSGSSTYNSLTAGISLDNNDAVSTAEAIVGVTTSGQGIDGYTGFIRVNLNVSTIQGWINGTYDNNGYVIVNALTDSSGDGLQIDSSESATQARKPKLVISYIV